MILQRFVITEFFRTPNVDWGIVKIWYYRNTDVLKRRIIIYPNFIEDKFFDNEGAVHRDYGQPAIITSSGGESYYYHGKLHRGHFEPAVIYSDGLEEYWVYGEKRFETASLRSF